MDAKVLRVVLVGVGTLGSAVFEGLARALIGSLLCRQLVVFLIDHDIVRRHNLHKVLVYGPDDLHVAKVLAAQRWARKVNPALQVAALPQRVQNVGLGLLRNTLVIITVDSYRARLDAARAAWEAGAKLILIGGLQGGDSPAGLYQRYLPGEGPCLECGYGQAEYSLLEHPFPCTVEGDQPGPEANIAAALRVASLILDETLTALSGQLPGEALEVRMDPSTYGLRRLRPVPRSASCWFDHKVLAPVILLQHQTHQLTLGELFALADRHLGTAQALLLRQPVATGLICEGCGHRWTKLCRLLPSVRFPCPHCGAASQAYDLTWRVDRRPESPEGTVVADLVPRGDILTLVNGQRQAHFGLDLPASWMPASEDTVTHKEVRHAEP